MKKHLIHQKRNFNQLILKYNKSVRRLERLVGANRNQRKQGILKVRIERMFKKIQISLGLIRKSIALTSMFGVAAVAANVSAQTQFAGTNGMANNAFGIVAGGSNVTLTVTEAVEMWDMDGDGDMDAFTRVTDSGLVYRENIGTATAPNYSAPQMLTFTITGAAGSDAISFGDLDNDGDGDMLLGTATSQEFKYFENTGTASAPVFSSVLVDPFNLYGFGKIHPELIDLDNDGDLDVMHGSFFGSFYYFENVGTSSVPNYSTPLIDPFGLTDIGIGSTPSMKDIDNDGDLDLFSGTSSSLIYFFENTGTATAPAYASKVLAPFNMGLKHRHVRMDIVDFNGDGVYDIIAGNSANEIMYYYNVGTSTNPDFSVPNQRVISPFGIEEVVAGPEFADIDNDGDLDLFASSYSGAIDYYENIGSITSAIYGPKQVNPFNLAFGYTAPENPKLVDIDNDGDLDLFTGESYASIIFFENTGTASAPNFPTMQSNPFGLSDLSTAGYAYGTVSLDDIDSDGDFDLIAGEYYGEISYYENTGSATAPAFGPRQVNPMGLTSSGYRSHPEFVDMDLDGDLDILSGGGYYSEFNYYENTGTSAVPAFAPSVLNPFGISNDYGCYISTVAFADIDGDGDQDLISGGSFVSLFENITPNTGLGIEQNNSFETSMFPNPTNGLVSITSNQQIRGIEVYNIAGQLLLNTNNHNNIDISELPVGIYQIVIISEHGNTSVQKLMKN